MVELNLNHKILLNMRLFMDVINKLSRKGMFKL